MSDSPHELVSDSDADEETRIAVMNYLTFLSGVVNKDQLQEKIRQMLSQKHDVNVKMQRIYIQFGKLCAMIEEEGIEIPGGIVQDFHEHVLNPLCEKLLFTSQ